MRYCRYMSEQGARYARVEMREGAAWAVAAMEPPEEDLAAVICHERYPMHSFTPVTLAEMQRAGDICLLRCRRRRLFVWGGITGTTRRSWGTMCRRSHCCF